MRQGVQVSVRQARPSDMGFIYTTWIETFQESAFARFIKSTIYKDRQRKLIDAILARPTTHVLVATPPGEDDVILSWLVVEAPDVAHYAFTKQQFRRLGIARHLMATLPRRIRFSHRVAFGEPFLKHIKDTYDVEYDPYSAYRGLS